MSIATIIEEQIKDSKTMRKFAGELGLSHSMLSLILSGERNAGGKTIRALIRHPDTREQTISFLRENVTVVDINGNGD